MRILAVEQGTEPWLRARLGLPSCSNFDRILTPKTLKPSSQAEVYMNQLLAEWFLGHPIDWFGSSQFMERGTAMEPRARAHYEFQRDVTVQVTGLVLREDEMVCGSPDGLVGEDGGLEIKNPAIHTHIGYLCRPDSLVSEYRSQVQGYMYLTGRPWWDLLSYHDELPEVCIRLERDEPYLAALDAALESFVGELLRRRAVLEPHRQAREAAVREAQAEAREGWAA